MPTLKISNSEDEHTMKLENWQNKLEYNILLDKAIKRKDKYSQNLCKAYAFLWEKCSCAMQNKITGLDQMILNNNFLIIQ